MALRELIGTIKCLNRRCTAEVPVKKGAGGAVSASCPYCDLSAYGKEGTQSKRDILADMKPLQGPVPDPAPAPAPKPVAKPAPAAAKSAPSTIFG